MKKYIEQRRKEKLNSSAASKSPTRRKRTKLSREPSSPAHTPFVKKQTIPPSGWGQLKEVQFVDENLINKNPEMKKISKMKEELKTLREELKANDISEFKRLIGFKGSRRNKKSSRSQYSLNVTSKVKADILGSSLKLELRNTQIRGRFCLS